MSENKIKHLYARAGFGLSAKEWVVRKDWPISKVIEDLFQQAAIINPLPEIKPVTKGVKPLSTEERAKVRKKERALAKQVGIDWLLRMADSMESSLVEKMSLLWHGHFACRSLTGYLANNQLNTIRQHGLGNFKDLVKAIAKDASMIRFLDNQKNRKDKPNENFARELMELFTIGIGHYTEQDVKEAARAFTGWSSMYCPATG